ncbi:MAG: hypothetical protein M1470_10070 [Bacteroidetes bacterium]|nr:hypothetical protein [Bacteroidota bacterium]
MKRIYCFAFFVSLLCIGKTGLMAQTPILQTQAPVINQTYVYDSLSTATFGANVTFNGSVNPNGLQCSVYFEYGPTKDYHKGNCTTTFRNWQFIVGRSETVEQYQT